MLKIKISAKPRNNYTFNHVLTVLITCKASATHYVALAIESLPIGSAAKPSDSTFVAGAGITLTLVGEAETSVRAGLATATHANPISNITLRIVRARLAPAQ